MTGLLPVTSNIFFDNFCANFFGSSLSTSNPVRNPILSLPNNVTVSLIGGHTDGNPVMDSNPQRIRMVFSVLGNYSNNSHDFLMYTFDYPVDLSVILDNLSTSRFFSMFASYNINPGSLINPISVGIRFIDIFGTQLVVNSSFKTFFASSTLFEDLDNISSQPPTFDSKRVKKVVVFLSIVINNLSPPSSLEFYSLGIRRYPVVGESITGTPTCFLYDNFMNFQKISGPVPQNDQLTLATGHFFNYTTSGQIIRTLESSGGASDSCTINIFENSNNPSSNSPPAAHIILNTQPSSSVKGTIKYGSNTFPVQINSQCVGVMAYRINSTIPTSTTLTVKVLDGSISLETRQYTNTTLNDVHDIEYITFNVTTVGSKILSFEFTNTNNSSSAVTIEVYVLYIMLWKKPSISLTPTLPNFFLDKTYHNLLTGSQPAGNPHGVFPKNVNKTYFNSPLGFNTTEDQYSTLITFSNSGPFSNETFVQYIFNPPADFTAIQNFIILATSNASNTNFSFEILIFSGSSSISYTSNAVTLNNHTSQMSVVRVDNLNTGSNDPITILSNVSTIEILLSAQGSSPPQGSTLRVYAIVCEYDCNIFPLYDNFILNQLPNSPLIITPSDRSFNFPGHPIRELPTPTSSNGNIFASSSINGSFNSPLSGTPIAKCFRIFLNNTFVLQQSGFCTFPLRYRNINLNRDLKYFLTLSYFLPFAIPSGATINSFTLNIKNLKTGFTLQTETLGTNLTHTSSLQQDINFIIDPPFEEDMEFEFVVDVSNLSDLGIIIDIPYIIIQAETTTCVLEGTRITMADGSLKKIEDIKRGDLVLTVDGPLPVCHVIKETLSGLISLCKVPKGSISKNIPYNDLYVCSRHVIRYNGKRRLATALKAFKGVEILTGKRNQITNKLYMYDLQFEIETFYYAEGLESQSRSPYCHLSPLPKELYFNKELYKDIKVPDCLMHETEGFDNNWPNVYNRFSWRTYLAKYILNHSEIEFKPEDFNEKKALELKDKEHIDLTEIIPDDFDWEEYVRAHKDLKHFKNEMEACVHWVKYGYRENRYYKKYPFV